MDDIEYVCQDAEGLSGGLLSCWEASKFRLEEVIQTSRWIALWGFHQGKEIIIINVYALGDINGQKDMWK